MDSGLFPNLSHLANFGGDLVELILSFLMPSSWLVLEGVHRQAIYGMAGSRCWREWASWRWGCDQASKYRDDWRHLVIEGNIRALVKPPPLGQLRAAIGKVGAEREVKRCMARTSGLFVKPRVVAKWLMEVARGSDRFKEKDALENCFWYFVQTYCVCSNVDCCSLRTALFTTSAQSESEPPIVHRPVHRECHACGQTGIITGLGDDGTGSADARVAIWIARHAWASCNTLQGDYGISWSTDTSSDAVRTRRMSMLQQSRGLVALAAAPPINNT